ncbi:MAG: hypothetical protein EON95_06580 [Caulobacteraceae bacterium]|nr:MAG: hypothetical protein EON95_06580 [Caulobacteraceae bacterium]
MRRSFIVPFALLVFAAPAVAAEPPGASAVVEALDQACRVYVKGRDYEGYQAAAGELGIKDYFGTLVRRDPGVDIFAIAATAEAPFARRCTIALDGPPALAEPVPAAIAAWARANGFKSDGAPTTRTNKDGRPYAETFWKAPGARLQLNAFGVGPGGRANVTVTWSVGD